MGIEGYDARELSPKEQDDLRRRVILAIRRGMKPAEASRTFNVSRTAIWNWRQRSSGNDLEALQSKPRGRPKGARLDDCRAANVLEKMVGHCPDQLGLPFGLWSREAVQRLMAEQFDLQVSIWTVGHYLDKWGMKPQKPLDWAYERNPKAIQTWLKREYPTIQSQAKQQKAEICWGVRMELSSSLIEGFKGNRGFVEDRAHRERKCHMISVMNNRGHLLFMVFRKAFTPVVMIEFLVRLIRESRQRIFLIVGQHAAYDSPALKKWLGEYSDRIRMFQLPARSQETFT